MFYTDHRARKPIQTNTVLPSRVTMGGHRRPASATQPGCQVFPFINQLLQWEKKMVHQNGVGRLHFIAREHAAAARVTFLLAKGPTSIIKYFPLLITEVPIGAREVFLFATEKTPRTNLIWSLCSLPLRRTRRLVRCCTNCFGSAAGTRVFVSPAVAQFKSPRGPMQVKRETLVLEFL